MTPEFDATLARIREEHGHDSLDRFQQMLDNSVERDSRQSRAKWILPGASTTPWLDPAKSPKVQRLTERLAELHPQIKEECRRLRPGPGGDLTQYMHFMFPREDWNALYFFRGGAPVEESLALCPVTGSFLTDDLGDQFCPLLEMHFSVLEPQVILPPHSDLWNFTINLHFGVDVPDGCALRVCGETRPMAEGKTLLFDYSFEHDAWNKSDRRRTCLLIDIWNPELTLAEREAVTALVTVVRQFTGE